MKKHLCFITAFAALNVFLSFSVSAQSEMSYSQWSQSDLQSAELAASRTGNTSPENAVMYSSSRIDWTKKLFISDVSLDVVKAGIPLPSGKASSVNRIQLQLPVLIKDPLLSIYVDDYYTLGDIVLQGDLTLEELTRIIDSSKQTPAVFAKGGNQLLTTHTMELKNINSALIKHKNPYVQQKPIDMISTRSYTGIIIDARGSLPVQGEFVNSRASPCLFPKIWNDRMDLMYEKNMVDPEIAAESMIVAYGSDSDFRNYSDRVGNDPIWITAKKIFGSNRCDPVISYDDYLRITTNAQNLKLLQEGKVVILLDQDQLVHSVSAPQKNRSYYLNYHWIRREFYEDAVPDVVINDAQYGMEISVENLRFVADSAELLPEEKDRIIEISSQLKKITDSGEFTILVEGHTADVNKPQGQLNLSIERAQAIIEILVEQGISRDILTYKGYGGTVPVATNSTPEGRAQNRRVKITVMPKASYVQTQ